MWVHICTRWRQRDIIQCQPSYMLNLSQAKQDDKRNFSYMYVTRLTIPTSAGNLSFMPMIGKRAYIKQVFRFTYWGVRGSGIRVYLRDGVVLLYMITLIKCNHSILNHNRHLYWTFEGCGLWYIVLNGRVA